MKRPLFALALAAALPVLTACSTAWLPSWLRPYRPDVQQGNIITKDMVEQLRPGMTRDQVKFLLGTPTLIDIFHQNRWDYPYYLRRGNGEVQRRRLWVEFEDGKLARYRSDPMPTEPLADNLILGTKAKLEEPTPLAAPAPAAGAAPAGKPAPAAPGPAPTAPAPQSAVPTQATPPAAPSGTSP